MNMDITQHLEERLGIQNVRSLKEKMQDVTDCNVLEIEQATGDFTKGFTLSTIRKYVGRGKLIDTKEFVHASRIHVDTVNDYLRHLTPDDRYCELTLKRLALGLVCFWNRIVAYNARAYQGALMTPEMATKKAERHFMEELLMAFGKAGTEAIIYHEMGANLQPFIDLNYKRADKSDHLKRKKNTNNKN